MSDTGNSALAKAQVQWVETLAKISRGEQGDARDFVAVIEAATNAAIRMNAEKKNGNGWLTKAVIVTLLSLLAAGIIGGINIYARVNVLEKTCQQKLNP